MDENELAMLKVALGSFYRQMRSIEKLPDFYGTDTSNDFFKMICHLGELINVPDLHDCVWD